MTKNLPRYTFEFTCDETHHQLKLDDGSLRIFLNTKATALPGLDALMQAFYHYIQQGAVESELTRSICNAITTLKKDRITRRRSMTWALKMADARYDGFDEEFEQGIEKGMEKGVYQSKLETARRFLEEGLDSEMVARCTSLPMETVLKLLKEL